MDMMVIPNRGRVVALIWALALGGGLLMLALLAKPSQAQGQGAVSESMPLAFPIDASACAGEMIDITGTLHSVNHVTEREDGTLHANSTFHLVGVKGIGQTTGEHYVIPAVSTNVVNFVQPGQIVASTVDISLVIGKGQMPNQVATATIHFVVSPEGEVKVESIHMNFQCH
jgi:hypothetical protein